MRNKRTSKYWSNQIDDYIKSGLSINGYCRKNNLASSTFYYWLKKIRNQTENKPRKLVKVSVPVNANIKMKLQYNDVTVEFPAEFANEKISKLISALKEV